MSWRTRSTASDAGDRPGRRVERVEPALGARGLGAVQARPPRARTRRTAPAGARRRVEPERPERPAGPRQARPGGRPWSGARRPSRARRGRGAGPGSPPGRDDAGGSTDRLEVRPRRAPQARASASRPRTRSRRGARRVRGATPRVPRAAAIGRARSACGRDATVYRLERSRGAARAHASAGRWCPCARAYHRPVGTTRNRPNVTPAAADAAYHPDHGIDHAPGTSPPPRRDPEATEPSVLDASLTRRGFLRGAGARRRRPRRRDRRRLRARRRPDLELRRRSQAASRVARRRRPRPRPPSRDAGDASRPPRATPAPSHAASANIPPGWTRARRRRPRRRPPLRRQPAPALKDIYGAVVFAKLAEILGAADDYPELQPEAGLRPGARSSSSSDIARRRSSPSSTATSRSSS